MTRSAKYLRYRDSDKLYLNSLSLPSVEEKSIANANNREKRKPDDILNPNSFPYRSLPPGISPSGI
uniref:Uncharacterized protein n=1 Tax=Heterorhabditis bacteriophora TaxID=37862 RepID=A0A1I7XJF2_HETBA